MRRIAAAVLAASLVTLTAPAPAAGQPSRLDGLYLQNQSIGRGDAWNYYYFWPDGHVCRTMPKGGLDPAPSFAAVSQQAPEACGTYAIRGGQLLLQVGGAAQPTTLRVDRFTPSGFALSDFPTIHVPAFPAGARLAGAWSTTVIKGDDYRDETLTFRPDGTFSYDEHSARPMYATPPIRLEGTYALAGNTLRITAGDGTRVLSIHPFPNDDRLGVEGRVLRKTGAGR